MENKTCNGTKPAYPVDGTYASEAISYDKIGLTKREYFAGLAMQAILSNRELHLAIIADQNIDGTTHENCVAFHAVKEADQLLKQLEV